MTRSVGYSLLCVMVMLSALYAQTLHATHIIAVGTPEDSAWLPDGVDKGWYPREASSSLPTARGLEPDTYRWTNALADLDFVPVVPGVSYLLRLRMLNQGAGLPPAGLRILAGDQLLYAGITPEPAQLRVVRLLIPRDATFSDQLRLRLGGFDPQPEGVQGSLRTLGLLVTDIELRPLDPLPVQLSGAARWPWLPLAFLSPLLALRLVRRRDIWLPCAVLLFLAGLLWWPPGIYLLRWWAPIGLIWLGAIILRRLAGVRIVRVSIRPALACLAGLLLICAVLLFVPVIRSDGVGYYAYLLSVAQDGDLRLANEYGQFGYDDLVAQQTATGLQPNQWAVGAAMLWAPGYLLAEGIARLCGPLFLPCGWADQLAFSLNSLLTMLISALAGVWAALLGCRLSVRTFGAPPWSAALASAGLVLGTNWLFYSMRMPSFPHALSALLMALLADHWLSSQPRNLRFWGLLGLYSGLLVALYWVNVLLLVWPALSYLIQLWERRADRKALIQLLGAGLLAALVALLAFSPQIIAWATIYGTPSIVPPSADSPTPVLPLGFLPSAFFSPIYGLWLWMPLLGLGLFASPLMPLLAPRALRREVLLLLLAIWLLLGYLTSITTWAGGDSFGQRRLLVIVPLLIPLLALLLDRMRQYCADLPAIVVLVGSAWTISMMLRYNWLLIPNGTHELGDLRPEQLIATFSTLPLRWLVERPPDSYMVLVFRQGELPDRLIALAISLLVIMLVTYMVIRLAPSTEPQAATQ